MNSKPIFFLVTSLALACAAGLRAQLQNQSTFHTEQQKLLELKRAHLQLQNAKQRMERFKELYAQGLEPLINYKQAETEYQQAMVEYQRAFLALFSETPRLSVVSAVKSQAQDGRKYVRVVVRNSSGTNLDYRQLGIEAPDVPMPDHLKLRELTNVFVSLKNEKGTVISDPYEAYIKALKVDETATIDFQLLDDVDTVFVSMSYAGKLDERPVYLQKDASANIVTVQSAQFSQEADLGGTATYDLKLERFTKTSNTVKLQVVNLPKQIQYDFLDSREGSSRLSQYRFPEGETTKNLALRVYLPDLASEKDLAEAEITIDEPISFYALVLDQALADKYPADRRYKESEMEKIPAGKVKLELIPRGLGKLEVLLSNYYQEIKVGQQIDLTATIRNRGTRQLHNVKVMTELPLNWAADIEPDIIPILEVNKERQVRIRIKPTPEPGEYQVKIKTEAYSSQRKVQSEDKDARIHISAPANIWYTAGLIGFALLVVLGIVVYGVKITRR